MDKLYTLETKRNDSPKGGAPTEHVGPSPVVSWSNASDMAARRPQLQFELTSPCARKRCSWRASPWPKRGHMSSERICSGHRLLTNGAPRCVVSIRARTTKKRRLRWGRSNTAKEDMGATNDRGRRRDGRLGLLRSAQSERAWPPLMRAASVSGASSTPAHGTHVPWRGPATVATSIRLREEARNAEGTLAPSRSREVANCPWRYPRLQGAQT